MKISPELTHVMVDTSVVPSIGVGDASWFIELDRDDQGSIMVEVIELENQ